MIKIKTVPCSFARHFNLYKTIALILVLNCSVLSSKLPIPKIGVSLGVFAPLYSYKNTEKSKTFKINSNWGAQTLLHVSHNRYSLSIGYGAQTHKIGQSMAYSLQVKDKGTFQNYLLSVQQMPVLFNVKVWQKSKTNISLNLGYVKTVAVIEKVRIDNTISEYKNFKYYNLRPWRFKGHAARFGIDIHEKIATNWNITASVSYQIQLKNDYEYKASYNPNNEYNWPLVHYPNTPNPNFLAIGIGLKYDMVFNKLSKKQLN